MSAAFPVATPAPAQGGVPVVGSFALAAQWRMTGTGTTARVAVALLEDLKLIPATLVPALLSLGQQVLVEYWLTGHELPEVQVTAVERVATVLVTVRATEFTVGVPNDLAARRSSIALAISQHSRYGCNGNQLLYQVFHLPKRTNNAEDVPPCFIPVSHGRL